LQVARKAAERRAEVTLDAILAEYKPIAFTGMSRFLRFNDAGAPEVDLSHYTPADLDLLAEWPAAGFVDTKIRS